MSSAALALVLFPVVLGVYAYAGYPALLWLGSRVRRRRPEPPEPVEWPLVSLSVPVYNEAAQVRSLVESLLALDYPADRRQILLISDASTDGTDAIIGEYRDRGVELLRMPRRGGKTAAENASIAHLRGEIVVNTDASIRIRRGALRPLIRQFSDPTVGVASGRDVSVAAGAVDANVGEGGYVGYEMSVRKLETALGGIIGASGCLYAMRTELHRRTLPDHLSRDFAAALTARDAGFRSVSVDEAVCLVPRTASLVREYRRKVRTMSRGMETLMHMGRLLDPIRHGAFAWMLFSHKICRWLVAPAAVPALLGLGVLAVDHGWARWAAAAAVLTALAAWLGWRRALASAPMPRLLAMLTAVAAAHVAVLHAIARVLRHDNDATWEPTRRETVLSVET